MQSHDDKIALLLHRRSQLESLQIEGHVVHPVYEYPLLRSHGGDRSGGRISLRRVLNVGDFPNERFARDS